MKIKFDEGWKLKGWWPYEWMMGSSMETNETFDGITPWIDASVPGSIYSDLLKVGLIEDPYFGQNSLKCEWVSQRAWMYLKKFELDKSFKGKNVRIVFHGVDYESKFYLNGIFLGRHEGMFTPVEFTINELIRFDGTNELVVVIEKAPDEMDQIGYTSKTKTQKSRFGYKWDFGTKLVEMGIWKNVEISITGCTYIEDAYLESSLSESYAKSDVRFSISLQSLCQCVQTLMVKVLKDGINVVEQTHELICQKGENTIHGSLLIENPELWCPAGYGEQNLYTALIELLDREKNITDTKEVTFGIRKLKFLQNNLAPVSSLPYTIQVNGKEAFIKGWNFVPIDHMYGVLNMEKYLWLINLAVKANVNLLRVWGGGIVEREEFYNLCDQNGIMIWQEFIQSSSGIDNEACADPKFLELLKETAVSIIKQKRNHASLVIWCGGNELMDHTCKPHDYIHPNIKVLKELVDELSPVQLFLPTSASGPAQWLDIGNTGKGMHHDIHGQWRYLGTKEHYSYYNANDCLIHTEFGVQGCSCAATIKNIIPQENIFPINRHNPQWKHHGAAWWHTENEVKLFFGEISDLESFVKYSQFIQAEGLRYIVESNMRRKLTCSGVIPWQMNEPWPNAVCTNAVEFNGTPKMSYYWVKNTYSLSHLSLKYNKINYKAGEEFSGIIFAHSSFDHSKSMTVIWRIESIKGDELLSGRTVEFIQANACKEVMNLKWDVKKLPRGVFIVYLEGLVDNAKVCRNEYLFSLKEDEFFTELKDDGKVDLETTLLDNNDNKILIRARNNGNETALFVGVHADTYGMGIYCKNNYSSIRPGQTVLFEIETGFCINGAALRLKLNALNTICEWDVYQDSRNK